MAVTTETPTVLVVDDEPHVAEGYALWLGDEYETLVATDGSDALERVPDADAILLDRRMPGMSGDEVLDRIDEEGYDCRVAMVTAVDPDFDIIEMPFDAYVTKPVGKADIESVVDRLLTLSEYDDALQRQFSLARKRAMLESAKSEGELEDSDEYARLEERYQELSGRASELIAQMEPETFGSAVKEP
ncbi:MAG: CheY-like chemotaxis protein [Natronomonas sp.]|jgi:CheY-like chemotaxis protein|uniref:HalX domain-containing protein n=1 Tax=Natronomonas sp. TaxID=2184060 RepID=UPI00398907BC